MAEAISEYIGVYVVVQAAYVHRATIKHEVVPISRAQKQRLKGISGSVSEV